MGDDQGDRAGHELGARCAPIELLIADVNGVLTDGVIAIDAEGAEIKHFHVRDGLGYALWHRAGKLSAILSGRRSGPWSAGPPSCRSRTCSRATTPSPARLAISSDDSGWSRGRSATSATTCPTSRCSAPSGWPPARPTPSPTSAKSPTSSRARRAAAAPSARSSKSSSNRRGNGIDRSNPVPSSNVRAPETTRDPGGRGSVRAGFTRARTELRPPDRPQTSGARSEKSRFQTDDR